MRRRGRGLLLALEGIDGAGKSTVARALAGALRRRGVTVALWREPVDPDLGALAQASAARSPWMGAVYFTLDRFLARPRLVVALERHRVVVTDRSYYSTLAYQGSALPPRLRRRLEELSPRASVTPDRVVLLDLSPANALARLGRRSRLRGPLERRRVMERVARRYRSMAGRGSWLLLDARRPVRDSVASILDSLGSTLRPRRRGR